MQTFLPHGDFYITSRSLDDKRLGKQRLEAWHLLEIISGMKPDSRWRNHPVVKMWWGYDGALRDYGMTICRTWRQRGHRDTILKKFEDYKPKNNDRPWWLGLPALHTSHRSNLLRKDKDHYSQWFDPRATTTDLPYVWPQSELLGKE